MTPKKLQWSYIKEYDSWRAKIKGDNRIWFIIEKRPLQKFLIVSNISGVRNLIVRDFEYAKSLAQENFNDYSKRKQKSNAPL